MLVNEWLIPCNSMFLSQLCHSTSGMMFWPWAWLGVPAAHVLDAWVFSTPSSNVRRVFVGAQAVPDRRAELAPGFVQAMASLVS